MKHALQLGAVVEDLHPPHKRVGLPGRVLGNQGRELGHLRRTALYNMLPRA